MKDKTESLRRHEHYVANKAKLLEKAKEYRDANKEKRREYMKAYYRRRLKDDPEFRAQNLEYHRKYNAANREKMNAFNAVYREKNRAKINEYGRLYYARNKPRCQARARAKKYGISPEQFAEMLESQGGACAVCGKPLPKNHSRIAVDHCHETGTVRGLLHFGCNVAVGAYERLRGEIEKYLSQCSKSSNNQPPPRSPSGRSSTARGRSTPARSSGT